MKGATSVLLGVKGLSSAHKISENFDRLQLQPRYENHGWIGVGGAHTRANLVTVGVGDRGWSWKSVSCLGPLIASFFVKRKQLPCGMEIYSIFSSHHGTDDQNCTSSSNCLFKKDGRAVIFIS